MRIQKRIKGQVRQSLSPRVIKEIDEKVTSIARKYKVSKSFVISTLLAESLNIKKQEKFYE